MKCKTVTYFLIVIILVSNCFVGTQRDACRYYLIKNESEGCQSEIFSAFAIPPRDGNYQRATENAAAYLIYCLQYYEKLKDCDDDNNRFKPGLYGSNQLSPSFYSYLGNDLLFIYRRYSKYNIIIQS